MTLYHHFQVLHYDVVVLTLSHISHSVLSQETLCTEAYTIFYGDVYKFKELCIRNEEQEEGQQATKPTTKSLQN